MFGEEFKNVAYWTAQLVTDDNGTARIDVKLPDDLTTWRMQVRAVSGDTKVGEGIKVTGDLRTVNVVPGGTAVVSWPATVDTDGTAKFAFTATGTGGLTDAVRLEIPVLMDVTPETMATGGIVVDRSQVEAIYLPPFAKLKPAR